MKILLLGATGGLGKEILLYAIKNKINVNCLVRDPKKINNKSPYIEIFKGDATSYKDLVYALEDSSIVISTLNVCRRNIIPWSKITNSKTTISDFTNNILKISKEKQINRFISISAWGANETKKDIPFWFKYLIKFSNLKYPYKDHEKHEEIIKNSNLNWTILRPVAFINTKKLMKIKESYKNHPKPSLIINRKSLAYFIINIINDENYYKLMPVVSKD